jgi:hypothetical protein
VQIQQPRGPQRTASNTQHLQRVTSVYSCNQVHFQTNQTFQYSGFNNNAITPILGSGSIPPLIQLHKTVQDHTVIIRRVSVSMAAQHRSHAECSTTRNDALHKSTLKHIEDAHVCMFGSNGTNLYCWQRRTNMH